MTARQRRGSTLHDLSQPCGVVPRLKNVLAFQIRIVNQHLVNAAPGTILPDDHADCHPHIADAGLPGHLCGVLRDAFNVDMASPENAVWITNDRAKVRAVIEAGDHVALLLALRTVAEVRLGTSAIAAKTGLK